MAACFRASSSAKEVMARSTPSSPLRCLLPLLRVTARQVSPACWRCLLRRPFGGGGARGGVATARPRSFPHDPGAARQRNVRTDRVTVAEPGRPARGRPHPYAPSLAGREPGETRRSAWAHVSTSPEIRTRRQSSERLQALRDRSHAEGADIVF